jgi:PAS domain S-box-containing protein
MPYHLTSYALLPLSTAAVTVLLAYETWRRRSDPASPPFVLLTLLVAIWNLSNALEISSADVSTAFFWVRVEYIGIIGVPVAWLLMMFAFAERRNPLTRIWLASVLIVPLITTVVIWSPSAQPLFWRSFEIESIDPFTIISVERGSWFWVHTAYSYLLLLSGTLILLRSLRNTTGLYRDQSLALLIGVGAPWLMNIIYLLGLIPRAFPDPTGLAFVITTLSFSWAMRGAGLFELGPIAYREVFQQMSDGVLVLDSQNRIVDLNSAAVAAMNRPIQVLVGKPIREALADWPDLVERYSDLVVMDRSIHAEISFRTDDDMLVYDVQVTLLRGKRGMLTGRMLVWRDITEIKQAMVRIEDQNKQLENHALALQDAKAAAEAGSQAKSVFLTTMSHELRTPLSAMLGYAELIQYDLAEQDHAALDRDLTNIKIAGEHLLNMIGGILDYAKIEAGKMKLDLQTFLVHGIVVEALASVRPLIERNANRLNLEIPADFGTMYSDPIKLRQVLINLLSNAAKFTQSGEVTLRVHMNTNESQQDLVVFEISDTGVGMSEGQMDQLFQEFSQVITAPTGQIGTGLGLALSQKLSNLMGGRITVVSQPGQGTTFTVTLPARAA